MKNKDIKELKWIRSRAINRIRTILPSIAALENELEELQAEYKDYKIQYEQADHALAQVDGRLEKVAIGKSEKQKKLTLEQIKSIAEKLRIKL